MQPRCRIRVLADYPANILSDHGTGEGALLDLSLSGCRLRSDIALTAGSYLALQIIVAPELPALTMEVAVIRWAKDGIAGVEFIRYNEGDRERIAYLVAALPPAETPPLPGQASPTKSITGS